MQKIADYRGKLLNHVETLYRSGEHDLAIALAEALGCAISDTGFTGGGPDTFLVAHPNPDDRDMKNNASTCRRCGPSSRRSRSSSLI